MKTVKRLGVMVPLLAMFTLLGSCSGSNRGVSIGVHDTQLTPCPTSPNCVSSDAHGTEHQIAPFELQGTASEAWKTARSLVFDLPRTQIIADSSDYLHAECRTAVFGFVDDLELHLRPAEGVIAVRSAARTGYSDFGVNRQRIEYLRAALKKRGVVR